ncbi:UTP--GlnB (protein PII) uridylyltransferase, GlnD [Loktanella fryxellensis]|uniref:Bifunctional uridylyltransferase/uridylyl-removing enzyme n=1 Tax=Loktanella fryxellensis TaxID=245187 RepID=A0A1H8DEU7_9RHOB|nr:[protein-PII] uridylyltransferase [Loktanella fryxellensis]SEN05027.1 UTP--GlnB (protein PII) uridylyltransferase, GlnD [Loktanella fryxellensis]
MHRAASTVLAADDTVADTPPADLILPADRIFDDAAVLARLAEVVASAPDARTLRAATVGVLKQAQKDGRAAIAAAFLAEPFRASPTTRAYSYLTDRIVTTALDVARNHLHPLPNPTGSERLSVIAVGGYGRGEMAPHSDVDLLFLTPYKITPWAESVIEFTLYMLWDLKMKVGHASRTIKDCLRLATEDFTIRTSLVEYRYLTGDADLAAELGKRLWTDLFKSTAPEFIDAKLEERAQRHRKQGGQRYMVEPNVKEGKGGLRDLQSLYWIGKYIHGVRAASDLVRFKVFTQTEYEAFRAAHEFLWAVRCHLHLIAGRAQDQLTFDMQVAVSEAMGYRDGGGRRGVEHFMQAYFRQATMVGDLTRIFLVAQERTHTKAAPMLERLLKRKPKTAAPYAIKQNRLTVSGPKTFLSDPLNMLRIFDESMRTGTLMHPDAMRLVAANLHLIDRTLQNDPDANKLFLGLMLKHGNPERALRRMNELGVLGAFLPEFAPVVAMMQFNMYHHYTVDEHIIQCISHLSQIERGELADALPLATGILVGGVNRKVLYVALLLHDVGKGRTEDHSIVGAQIARRVCPRLGLSKKDSDTVEWLIRAHLLMSDTAQKRDISEPRTIRGFAKAVKSVERLNLLTVLTVCDIRGVGPGTWNNWKAVLLRNLYAATRSALENGLEDVNRETRENVAKRSLRDALSGWDAVDVKREMGRHYGPYWQGLPPATHVIFAGLLRDIPDDAPRIDLMPDPDRDATRACFAMVDHPGLFSRLSGALALVGANIVDARTYTSKDGYATAVFWLQDADGHPFEESRLTRLRQMIHKTLMGEIVPRDALADRDKLPKRMRAFRVPTTITFDNEGSEIYTIIEVDTRDRPGLLFDLTRTLANAHVYIASAVIATYGEQAVDTFYVKDLTGLKFHSESKRHSLERRLREAIDRGVERAQT